MSAAEGVPERSLARDWSVRSDAAIGLLVAGHFLFLALFFRPAISTPDANGYMAQARLIARQGRTDIVVESPAQYVGDHWMPVGPGRYYGQYPPGLPALLAVVFRSLGAYASLWVIPAMGSLSLLGLYLVARAWVGPGWALLAAGLMAVNPYANQHALGADSHTAVCFFLIWALFGLVRWDASRAPARAGRPGPLRAPRRRQVRAHPLADPRSLSGAILSARAGCRAARRASRLAGSNPVSGRGCRPDRGSHGPGCRRP